MEPNTQNSSQTIVLLEGVGGLMSSSWGLFKTHWRSLALIVGIPSACMYLGQILNLVRNPVLAIVGVIFSIGGLILSIAMQGATVNGIHRLSTESGVTLKWQEQYKIGFGMFWSFVLLIMMQMFISLGSVIFLIIPAITIGVYTGMYTIVRILEGKKGFAALTESYSLVKGHWWAVFGRILFLALIYMVVAIVVGIIASGVRSILGFGADTDGGIVITMIFNLFVSVVMGSVSLIYIYRLYNSLKSVRSTIPVSIVAFKKWLVGFLIVGIISAIVIPVIGGMALYKGLKARPISPGYQSQNSSLVENAVKSTDPIQVK